VKERERHVRPSSEGGWVVTGSATKVESHHQTAEQAEAWVKTILRRSGGGTIVKHDRRGQQQKESVNGAD
jgi:hypothetical protein